MSDPIVYNQLIEFLKSATLHETYRVSAAIQNELDDPKRIRAARQQFKLGDIVEYFNTETNTYISARVHKKNIKTVSLQHIHDKRYWQIPYYMLRLNSREMVFNKNEKAGLTRNTVKVGDWVGFNHDGEEIVGQVQRLNQKTVSLVTKDHRRWRVSYNALYAVIDGETNNLRVIECQIKE